MSKRKEGITDYCTAHDAAHILSRKYGRPIRVDYISKMVKSKNHVIRVLRFGVNFGIKWAES